MSAKSVSRAAKSADVAEARAEQARKAHQMRLSGKSWWDIAEELGISESMAMSRVDEAITAAATLVDEHTKRAMLSLEVDRLDALQEAHWPLALSGDVRSSELVLKIIAQRAKMLALDTSAGAGTTVQTVIVQGTSEEYISALRAATSREIG